MGVAGSERGSRVLQLLQVAKSKGMEKWAAK
jgi:hypothetical protein